MNKPTEVVVLCEDERTFIFAKRYLNRCGIIRIRPKITQKGCGYDFVLNEFANEVNAYRIANAKKNAWLIAVVDADTGTVAQRLGEMDKALKDSSEPRVKKIHITNERIARLVPRRNIETWLLALNDVVPKENPPLNETTDYKKDVPEFRQYNWEEAIRPATSAFYSFTRTNALLPANLLDSLNHGIIEMRRVEALAG